MKFSYYGYNGLSELEWALDEFRLQVGEGKIDPQCREMDITVMEPEDRLMLATDGGEIRGITRYMHLGSRSNCRLAKPGFVKLFGMSSYDPSDVVYLKYIESMRKGTGSRMLSSLKRRGDVDAVYLKPVDNEGVIGFYERNGFERGCYLSGNAGTVMVWKGSPASDRSFL